MHRIKRRIGTAAAAASAACALAGIAALVACFAPAATACVGRTITVGYYDAPDQELVANILAVFIDERTGTTVKLKMFPTRDEAFDAVRRDDVSLYADGSAVVLSRFGGEAPGPDRGRNVARLKEILGAGHNVVWVESFAFDRYFSGTGGQRRAPGEGGVMLCKDALSKFPALPRLLSKLRGALDNGTMEALLREAGDSDAKTVARRFLKTRKLI